MSLGEFKSLLNSALSVPHGADSQCSSDSPRSQSSVDSYRNSQMPQNKRTAANKSSHSYKPSGANRNISNMEKSNTLPRTKSSSLDCSSSGYSSSSISSNKSRKSANTYSPAANSPSSTYARTSVSRPKTPSSDSPKTTRAVTTRSNLIKYSSTGVSSSPGNQTKPQSSAYKTRSQSSLNSESSSVRLNNFSVPSRSSSQSSFKSYDSINEEDPYVSNDLRRVETDSYLPKYNAELESPSTTNYVANEINSQVSPNYTRSNSYTPSAAADDKTKWAEPRNELRANSEPKEIVRSESFSDKQPLNVGYASFSHQEQVVNSPGFLSPTCKFDEELSKIESELKKYESNNDDISGEINLQEEKPVSKTHSFASQPPARRPSTPSLIPRPATPKMSRKLSLTTGDDNYIIDKQTDNRGRPPTPKKSNIIARAHSGNSSIKASESSQEKTYKDIFQSKRSTTPGPGNVSTNSATDNIRRCTTPGPNMSRTSSLSTTSATVSRARLNQTLDQNKDAKFSVFDDSTNGGQAERTKSNSRSRAEGVTGRRHSVDSRSLNGHNSSKEAETVIMVNRSDEGHSLTVQDQAKSQAKSSANRPTVLARARTEDARSRTQTRTNTGITRQRPQSVEPRQLISRSKNTPDSNVQNGVLSVHRGEDGNHSYNRTQEWVQTAAEQTSKVQKTKVMKQANPKVRRAMTPNSFHKRIDQEEPRSLEEIKAALTLPINGLNRIEIDTENLDAPPEDPEMYATMEKLFNELRKQELKASVNETPGSNLVPAKSTKSKSKSSSSMNDEEASLDSNKNIKQKKFSLSTRSSNVTSPSVPQKKTSFNCNVSQPPTGKQPSRTISTSSVSANPSTSTSRSTQPSTPRSTPPRATPPRTVSTPRSDPSRPASPSMNRSTQPPRPMSPSMNRSAQPARPASPSMNRTVQSPRPSSPSMNRSAQPAKPASPRTAVSAKPSKPSVPRPASPRTTSNPPSRSLQSPASPRNPPASQVSSTQQSMSPQTPRQPPRPASTPPRPSTPIGRTSSSQVRDDSDGSQNNGKESPVGTSSLMLKIKEILKVKPRKDKAEGVKQKSRIPAPKSLASAGKSRSFSNLSSTGRSMTLPNTKANGHLDYSAFEGGMNGIDYENEINGGLNVTMSGQNEAPKLKMAMPLTTGRATVIRKESIEKNKNPPRLIRAVSVERNMGGLKTDFQFYREGEYVWYTLYNCRKCMVQSLIRTCTCVSVNHRTENPLALFVWLTPTCQSALIRY